MRSIGIIAYCVLVFTCIFTVSAQKNVKERNVVVKALATPEVFTAKQWEDLVKTIDMPTRDSKPTGNDKQPESAGKSNMAIKSQIIGGTAAARGNFPWQGYVIQDNAWFCGGSLVHVQWMMTAAHCAKNITLFDITLGATNQAVAEAGVLKLKSTTAFVHPQYNPSTIANDIALIKLPSAVNLAAYTFIGVIRLPTNTDVKTNKTFAGNSATVSGWGRTQNGGSVSAQLNYVVVPVILNSVCVQTFGSKYVISSTLCTSGTGIKGSCNGDSGGPLVYKEADGKFTQIGIVSFGAGDCTAGYPSAFTRVTSYLGFISNITGTAIRP